MQFYSISPVKNLEVIEAEVAANGGVLNSASGGLDCPKRGTWVVGEWEISLTDTRGVGNRGTYVVRGLSPEANTRQIEGLKRHLRAAADALEAECSLSDCEGLVYSQSDVAAWGHPGPDNPGWVANQAVLSRREDFRERGNIGEFIIPPMGLGHNHRNFLFADEKWAYFAHSCANFLSVGNGYSRVWVRPSAKRGGR